MQAAYDLEVEDNKKKAVEQQNAQSEAQARLELLQEQEQRLVAVLKTSRGELFELQETCRHQSGLLEARDKLVEQQAADLRAAVQANSTLEQRVQSQQEQLQQAQSQLMQADERLEQTRPVNTNSLLIADCSDGGSAATRWLTSAESRTPRMRTSYSSTGAPPFAGLVTTGLYCSRIHVAHSPDEHSQTLFKTCPHACARMRASKRALTHSSMTRTLHHPCRCPSTGSRRT